MTDARDNGLAVVSSTLDAGTWTVVLAGDVALPKLEASHAHRVIPGISIAEEPGETRITVPLPPAVLSDGLQSVHLTEKKTGATIASLHVAAGRTVPEDLRAELALLRDELDLLKRAFRRHLAG